MRCVLSAKLARAQAVVDWARGLCADWHLGGVRFVNHRAIEHGEAVLAAWDAAHQQQEQVDLDDHNVPVVHDQPQSVQN